MKLALGLSVVGLVSLTAVGIVKAQAPMQDDAAFAAQVWDMLAEQRLVGENAIGAVPYLREGQAHGATLVTFLSTITLAGAETQVLVKRSYAGEDATRENIIANPGENLSNITVMVKREAGYDPANQDWFWAMYGADGMVGQMEGMNMAGQVAMCSGCHATAPGGDYIFLHD